MSANIGMTPSYDDDTVSSTYSADVNATQETETEPKSTVVYKDSIAPTGTETINKSTTNASDPQLPTVTQQNIQESDVYYEKTHNAWFNVSFISAFKAIMDELLDAMRETRYMEAQNELKARKVELEIAESTASLTKALYDTRAQEKQMEAIQSFCSAGMASISFMQQAGAAKVADKQATAEVNANKAEFDKVNAKKPGVGPEDPKGFQERCEKNPELKDAYVKWQKSIENHGTRAGQIEHMRSLQIQNMNTMMTESMKGVMALLQAGLTVQEGTIDAMIKMNEGFAQAIRGYSDNCSRAKEDAKALFDKFIETMQQIISSDFRAHRIGTQ